MKVRMSDSHVSEVDGLLIYEGVGVDLWFGKGREEGGDA